MGELKLVSIERTIDADAVTQAAEYETAVHPEGREDDAGNSLAGQEYQELVVPELRGTITFTVTAEASGFDDGAKAQIDIGVTGGYREFKLVDLPVAGPEAQPGDPLPFTVTFGPGPVGLASGQATALAYLADAEGNLLGAPVLNQEGTLSYPELSRLDLQ